MIHYQVEHRISPDHRWRVIQVWRLEQHDFRRFYDYFHSLHCIETAEASECYRIRRSIAKTADFEFNGWEMIQL